MALNKKYSGYFLGQAIYEEEHYKKRIVNDSVMN